MYGQTRNTPSIRWKGRTDEGCEGGEGASPSASWGAGPEHCADLVTILQPEHTAGGVDGQWGLLCHEPAVWLWASHLALCLSICKMRGQNSILTKVPASANWLWSCESEEAGWSWLGASWAIPSPQISRLVAEAKDLMVCGIWNEHLPCKLSFQTPRIVAFD